MWYCSEKFILVKQINHSSDFLSPSIAKSLSVLLLNISAMQNLLSLKIKSIDLKNIMSHPFLQLIWKTISIQFPQPLTFRGISISGQKDTIKTLAEKKIKNKASVAMTEFWQYKILSFCRFVANSKITDRTLY